MSEVKITAEELKSLVDIAVDAKAKEVIDAKIKELGVDKINAKFVQFGGKDIEEIKSLNAKEKIATFIKAVHNKDFATLASFKAMNEGTGSAGGYVVPEEWTAEVNRIVEDFGLASAMARKIPMNSDTMNMPTLSSSVTGTYAGETVAGTPSQPVLANVQLLAKTFIGLTPMSNELLADANVSIVDLLSELFAEAIAKEIDTQTFAGTGAPFTGLLNHADVEEVIAVSADNTIAEVCAKPDYFRDMQAKIKPFALQGAGYFMHRTIWNEIQKAKSSVSGEYLLNIQNISKTEAVAQGYPIQPAGLLFNYPVFLTDVMPALADDAEELPFVVFGNLKHVYLGDRDTMTVTTSEHATVGTDNLFEQNMSAVRVTTRHAIAVGLPKAFCRLVTGATP
jgi:HK97 family phage major capsid protein